ncbi:adenylate/guanylate cyclase domain-containing protein [Bacteroidota bacterium]
MPKDRRLAAIMFTDIVGYTTLMGSDQDKAFQLLRKNREIQQQLIKEHSGVLLKEMGDGILAQFNSATDAVQCAIEIQKRAREELEGKIRIGIHLGDVTFENEDVFGDGVNIASRLQSVTDPGGIYISESTQKAIRGRSDIQTRYLGEFNLKNVDYPVRTYCVQGEGLPVPSSAKIKKLTRRSLAERVLGSIYTYIILLLLVSIGWWIRKEFFVDKSAISSVIFLPFDNYTNSDTLDYLFAGMHDALIGEAGKISAWQVKSKTTANAFRNADKSITDIASEINIDAAVETSVSCFGEQVCFQVAVVDAREDKQLWIKDFTVEKSQIPNLFRKIAREISREINVILTPQEEELLAQSETVDTIAYDLYLKGMFNLDQMSNEALLKAEQYFNLAIEKEPDWAPPYRGLEKVVGRRMQMGFEAPSIAIPKRHILIARALELDPNAADLHGIIAGTAAWSDWDWEKAEKEFKKCIELEPSDSEHRMFYAHLLTILRRMDEALYHAKIAQELDPLNPFSLGLYAVVLLNAGECETALTYVEKALSIEPDHYFTSPKLWGAWECLGEYEKVFDMWKQINIDFWEEYEQTEHYEKTFREHGWIAVMEVSIKFYEEVLKKERQLNPGEESFLAYQYITVGNYDKALEFYEKLYEMHNPNLPYISTKTTYDKMKNNPRYIELLKKMNLPVD